MSFRTSTMRRPNTSAPGDGSRTMTIISAPPSEDEGPSNNPDDPTVGVLRLRATTRKPRQKVVWREDVVDNEGAGRKSSKICCIYHKPRAYDESSDEDSSDSDSDSSCDHDHSGRHHHVHSSNGRDGEGLQNKDSGSSIQQFELDHDDSLNNNAYEVAPSSKKGKHKAT